MIDSDRPLLFLDVDGVLNRCEYDEKAQSHTILRECVDVLNTVIKLTDCDIVLSSSWRYMVHVGAMKIGGFEYLLRTHGAHVVDKVIGLTTTDEEVTLRGDQIQAWLRTSGRGRPFAIVDDLPCHSLKKFGGRVVFTNHELGLTAHDGVMLTEILRAPLTAAEVEEVTDLPPGTVHAFVQGRFGPSYCIRGIDGDYCKRGPEHDVHKMFGGRR